MDPTEPYAASRILTILPTAVLARLPPLPSLRRSLSSYSLPVSTLRPVPQQPMHPPAQPSLMPSPTHPRHPAPPTNPQQASPSSPPPSANPTLPPPLPNPRPPRLHPRPRPPPPRHLAPANPPRSLNPARRTPCNPHPSTPARERSLFRFTGLLASGIVQLFVVLYFLLPHGKQLLHRA